MELFVKIEGENGTEYVPFELTKEEIEAGQAALKNWQDVTRHINNGFLGFLAEIKVLVQNPDTNEIDIDLAGFNKRSFIDGLLSNTVHFSEEVTTDAVYRGIMAALKGFRVVMKEGRPLPLDVVRCVKHLAPLAPYYEYYSRQDAELSALLDQLLPKLRDYLGLMIPLKTVEP